jgi:DNA repair protein RadA/Sms
VRFAQNDVYLNVAGGLRVNETAADLAVAAALVSSLSGVALPADCVYFGEVSLSGAVRAVSQAQSRLKEARKLGFTSAFVPEANAGDGASDGGPVTGLSELADLVAQVAARSAGASERD